MDWIKKAAFASLLVSLLFLVNSCSMKLGLAPISSIDYTKVKTISIADFQNRAEYVYAPLATEFNQKMKDMFIQQTRLQLVNSGGDLEIDGEITGYNQYNESVGASGYSSKVKVTLTVNVRYTNNTNHEEDFKLMTPTHLQQWIQHPETLNRDTLYELRTLVARYPYFQSLRLLYLKNLYLLHDINFGAELRKAVLYVADRRVLFYFIEGDRYTLKSRKVSSLFSGDLEKEPSVDRTLSLIDAFLATVPEEHSQHTELDYAVDYTAYLMQEEPGVDAEDESEVPKLRGHELIDDFIQKSESSDASDTRREFLVEKEEETEEEEEPSVSPVTEELDDSCFTETLAKIYIKQHRYDKALEIIKKLSLNYPKKNAYFADQIRFLEKLIINAKSK